MVDTRDDYMEDKESPSCRNSWEVIMSPHLFREDVAVSNLTSCLFYGLYKADHDGLSTCRYMHIDTQKRDIQGAYHIDDQGWNEAATKVGSI
jgi:hypothetical protein